MDAKIVLPLLSDAMADLAQFRDALETFHSMIGAQLRQAGVDGMPVKLTENGFLVIADAILQPLANAHSQLGSVSMLIEAMPQESAPLAQDGSGLALVANT